MSFSMIRPFLLLTFLVAATGGASAQDTIILVNGEVITGKIVEEERERIVVEIPYGSIRIATTDIARIVKEQVQPKRPPPLIERAPTPPPVSNLRETQPDQPIVTPSGGESGNIVRAVDACLKDYEAKRIPPDEFPTTLAHIGDESIPYLLSLLGNKNYANLQAPLILALGKLKAKSALTIIASFTKSSTASIRKAAVVSLREIGGRETVAPLLAAVKDKDRETADIAVEALSYLATTDPEIARWVVGASYDFCASGDETVRARTAELLSKIEGEASFALLAKIAHEDRGKAQRAAIRSLVSINSQQAKTIIVECLSATESESKIEACKAISLLKTKEAIPQLIELLNDSNAEVSETAYQTLLAISSGRNGKNYQAWKEWWQYISTKQ